MAPPKEKDRPLPFDANLGIFNERTGMYETPAPKPKPEKASSSSTASPSPATADRVPTIFDKGYDKYARSEARRRLSPSKGTQAKRESTSAPAPLPLPRPQSSPARPVVVAAAATKPRPAKVVKRVVGPNVPKTWFNDMFGVKGKAK
ncbi:hypothetical protein FQN55_007992 [Onygenales sp. PD_40]|nr:hypothetical protein FQN55_007992 [Onygenales sp. PD_40]